LEALLLAIVFTWPAECEAVGKLYFEAAKLRDTGASLEFAVGGVKEADVKLAITHVYSRADMKAEQWRYFATGACVGSMERDSTKPKRKLPAMLT
jgi:hypothetical protein